MPNSSSSNSNSNDLNLNRLNELLKLVLQSIESKKQEYEIDKRNEIMITRGQRNRAKNVMEEWLSELSGDVIAELNFIDKTTFGYLDCIPKRCGIRIITSRPKEFEKCLTLADNCSIDRPHFEIVKINKIHQRWIGSKTSYIIDIGTDLKNDALGRSTHSMKKLEPEHCKKSIAHFEDFWKKSQSAIRAKYGNGLFKVRLYPR